VKFTPILEPVMVAVAWALLVIYHLNLFFDVKRQQLSTAIGITNHFS
jgi:hypothetical protein